MSKIFAISTVLLGVILIVGCEEPLRDGPHLRVDPAMLRRATSEGLAVPEAAEVDLVETMAASRNEYHANLESLRRFYAARGNATKRRWAEKELDAIGKIPQYRYLMPAESATASQRATDSIEDADILYNEAMRVYAEAGGFLIITDNQKLRVALNKFNELISVYPSSDKIDDSSYRAGRIYEHFKDYEVAATYYQRTFQWNEVTPYPARYRAAKILDRKLHMRREALTLYRLACQLESRYTKNIEYAEERIKKLSKPIAQPEELDQMQGTP